MPANQYAENTKNGINSSLNRGVKDSKVKNKVKSIIRDSKFKNAGEDSS